MFSGTPCTRTKNQFTNNMYIMYFVNQPRVASHESLLILVIYSLSLHNPLPPSPFFLPQHVFNPKQAGGGRFFDTIIVTF